MEPEDSFQHGAAPLKLDSEEKMLGGKRFGGERGSASFLTVLWINGCAWPAPVCCSDRVIVGSYKALGGLAWFGFLNRRAICFTSLRDLKGVSLMSVIPIPDYVLKPPQNLKNSGLCSWSGLLPGPWKF